MKRIARLGFAAVLAILWIVVTGVSAAPEPVPPAGASGPPVPFDYPQGATVAPALLLADVVKGEALDRAGLSKCDFVLGFDTEDGTSVDLSGDSTPDVFRGKMRKAAGGTGAYPKVMKRSPVTLPGGEAAERYDFLQPRPRILQNPTPGNYPIAATVLTLVVTDVAPRSAADREGMKPGDIIYSINDVRILGMDSTQALDEAMKKPVDKAGQVTLELVRCQPWGDGHRLHDRRRITFVPGGEGGAP